MIGWTPTDPTVQDEPCDMLQVRFIDDAGEISTWGYPLTEVNETGFGGWIPRQLGPLVVAIGQAVDPPPVYEDDNCDATSGEPFGARTTTRASSERSSPWSETATAGPSPRGKSPAADRELNHPW